MRIFKNIEEFGCEKLIFFQDKRIGLRAAIAIDSTSLGPPVGGIRMFPYKSENKAIIDALKLARAFTYKTSIMGLKYGGAKAVIIGDPEKEKTEILLKTFAKYLASLGGIYTIGEDIGINTEDSNVIRTYMKLPVRKSGVIPRNTAVGVFEGMRASLGKKYGDKSLKNKVVAIQGAGKVGYRLAELIYKEGAHIIIADKVDLLAEKVVKDFKAEKKTPHKIYKTKCDIFSPCATGGILNKKTIPKLKCHIVAGSANNQLLSDEYEKIILKRNILYVPDFVINAGGILTTTGKSHNWIGGKIYKTISEIFRRTEIESKTPLTIAKEMAEKRLKNPNGKITKAK